MTKAKKRVALWLAVILLLSALLLWHNNAVSVTRYRVEHELVPEEFNGFRVLQISDLHNKEFGKGNARLLARMRELSPDIIVFTGDLIDSRRTDTAVALALVEESLKIAPCYLVTGNHEQRIAAYPALEEELCALGATVLKNEAVTLEREGALISLIGLEDPAFALEREEGVSSSEVLARALAPLASQTQFDLVLSHRPEAFDAYVAEGVELVLTGHAHGGQIRLPFVGGVFVPSQGFFPELEEGRHEREGTTMLISRGLGNSAFPFRVNNAPELVLVELAK